jgi:hypothetical protein
VQSHIERVFRRLDNAWSAFKDSYTGLPDARLLEPGVVGDWSVKDILAHVNTWEDEALKYLPVILQGGKPPRYVAYGGIDAFNAQMTEQKRDFSLPQVRRLLDETHSRLVELIRTAPEDQLVGDTRFRRRLRLDTYGHYPQHAEAIREWRARA